MRPKQKHRQPAIHRIIFNKQNIFSRHNFLNFNRREAEFAEIGDFLTKQFLLRDLRASAVNS
jgi:hypothetical protein